MQDNLSVRLGFDSAEFLGADLPLGIDRAAIVEALTEALDANADVTDMAGSKSLGLRTVVLAGQYLLNKSLTRETLYLVNDAFKRFRDRPALAILRVKALRSSRKFSEVVLEIDRLLQSPATDRNTADKYVKLLRQFHSEHALTGRIAYIPLFWGDISTLAENFMERIEQNVSNDRRPVDIVAAKLMELRGITLKHEQRTFLRRLRRGREIAFFVKFMRQCSEEKASEKTKFDFPECKSHVEKTFANLIDRVAPLDLSNLLDGPNKDRSLLIASAHAGTTVYLGWDRREGERPLSLVSQGEIAVRRHGDFHLKTGTETTAKDFLKLVKLAKKEPRIIRIFPDGPDGEQVESRILSKRFSMGKGAAMIAYLSGAATCFGSGNWTGERYQIVIKPGPDPKKFETRDDFDAEFTNFYATCITEILMGPPENIGNGAGFWRMHVN